MPNDDIKAAWQDIRPQSTECRLTEVLRALAEFENHPVSIRVEIRSDHRDMLVSSEGYTVEHAMVELEVRLASYIHRNTEDLDAELDRLERVRARLEALRKAASLLPLPEEDDALDDIPF